MRSPDSKACNGLSFSLNAAVVGDKCLVTTKVHGTGKVHKRSLQPIGEELDDVPGGLNVTACWPLRASRGQTTFAASERRSEQGGCLWCPKPPLMDSQEQRKK
ncbi:hypothetical protein AAFF_G00360110 [Aldrovandia affinis]|uniref:Uncharacterized protein n=1 Tax=Aldrovandia affinis TaxID=143900 RepID=A0AAD7WNE6_9TELE|nr:hypothetical protein AAFF_G00360110 [Aldrovandia affinis]